MYCILSQSNDIVASDLEFLNLFGTTSLVDLYKKITSEDVKISLDYDKITLTVSNNTKMYDIKATPLTTLFGKSVLVELMSINIKSEFIKAPNFDTQASNNIKKTVTKVEVTTTKQPKEEKPVQPIRNEPIIESGFDLENLKDIGIYTNEPEVAVVEEQKSESFIDPKITIDIPSIAKNMHLSEEEYRAFLNEYTSSVDQFKKDLLGDDKKRKENTINFMKHITTALNMPKEIDSFVNSLNANSSKELLNNFFDVISNIKKQNTPLENLAKVEEPKIEDTLTTSDSVDKLESIEIIQPINEIEVKQKDISEDILPSIDINESIEINLVDDHAPSNKPKESASPKIDTGKVEKIDLSKVKPLPFDFILEESAKELSLPNDIVKEFIKDFIEQCHADTDKIMHKYDEGNIEKVKKLAHSLKGVASNLYVMPLANSLLELQNNDDLSQVKPLVERYWGQFLYLENIMKNI